MALEHFPEKWPPVFRQKMRPLNKTRVLSGSLGPESALATRLMVAMTGLSVLTAMALALIAYQQVGPSALLSGIATAAAVQIAAIFIAGRLARRSRIGPVGLRRRALGGVATELRGKSAALIEERRTPRDAESALEQSAQRERLYTEKFRLAVEACPSGMVMVDRAGNMVLVNTEIERLFGYSREALMGRSVDILVPERMHAQHGQHRETFARAPESRRMFAGRDLFGRRRDGTEFPVEVSLNPIHTSEGLFILAVVVDISARKRTDRLKDEFVSTVSHELRTPLTSISGSLGLLLGGAAGKLAEPAARLLTIAQTNSQRLIRLINDILDIEKMESGQIVFHFRRVDARALIEQAIEANRGYADGFKVRLRLDPAAADADVYADPDRLAQVLTNLLSNAIKFSPADGEVIVATEHRSDIVRICVRDHGPGIPADFKPRIFEKFAQADATDARQKGGTGLGLSIVKQIVARLGGKVGVGDAPGGGTVFHVDLPSIDQVIGREIDSEAKPGAPRVLLCEDDPDAATTIRDGLRHCGFATDFAHTRPDAIARAAQIPYGAILVDLQLPGGDGANLIRELRREPRIYKTPIIAMTADGAAHADVLDLSEIEGLAWLDKPVDVDRLAELLDRVALPHANGRPQILHVDDDPEVLETVAQALHTTATVTSVGSLDEARRVLAGGHFDLAVLDITLGAESGLDLLPDLRSSKGRAIPVIIFSAHGANQNSVSDPQVQANLKKSRAALDNLIATVHDRLTLRSAHEVKEGI
jgi:PAS domain S-box-containing protein